VAAAVAVAVVVEIIRNLINVCSTKVYHMQGSRGKIIQRTLV
jgi:hypothetical protein